MIDQINSAIRRSRETLPQDFAGLAALVTLFFVALHLPALF